LLGLLLSEADLDQAVNEIGATWPGTSSIVIGPTFGLTPSIAGFGDDKTRLAWTYLFLRNVDHGSC